MEAEVTFVERRGSALMRRSRRISGPQLRFGRGTGNDVGLPDIRVDLSAAVLSQADNMLAVEAVGPSPLFVNRRSTRRAALKIGDAVEIGPYRVRVTEPPVGVDIALSVELAHPLGDTLARLNAQTRLRLEGGGLGKRAASWIGAALVLLLFLVGPIAAYYVDLIPIRSPVPAKAAPSVALSWMPGELSNAHRFFAGDCATCHQSPFRSVRDAACTACHGKDRPHFLATASLVAFQPVPGTARCTDCHEEHRGKQAIVVSEAKLCLSCHTTLSITAPLAGVRDVSGFPAHPQFRVTLVADPAGPVLHRVLLGSAPKPRDRPGIKFSHAAHLVAGGFPALGYRQMQCGDCHVRAPGGKGFLPITYKDRCERCHELTFARQDLPWPEGRVPHGDDRGIVAAVWNYYAGKALQGGLREAEPAVLRRAPGLAGSASAPSADPSPLDWVAAKTREALRTVVLDAKRGCGYCHYGTGPNGGFDLAAILQAGQNPAQPVPGPIVEPVALLNRFLPEARFDHAKHAALDCAQCHAARQSKTSGDVLIPGIETCRSCHGSEQAALRVDSTCITCHGFHHDTGNAVREGVAERTVRVER